MTALQGSLARSNFWAGAPQSFNPHKLPADATCTCPGGEMVGMGGGRAGESLKPHNFSQLGNRGSPAGFFSQILSHNRGLLLLLFFLKFFVLFEIHILKDAKKTQNSYFLSDLLSSLVSNSKTRVFDTRTI